MVVSLLLCFFCLPASFQLFTSLSFIQYIHSCFPFHPGHYGHFVGHYGHLPVILVIPVIPNPGLNSVLFLNHVSPTHSCRNRYGYETINLVSHYQFPKFLKLFSLQWLCHKVTNHVLRRTVFNGHVAFLDLVR